jgi:spore germination cell wall hydrolase CwlJ-like protein
MGDPAKDCTQVYLPNPLFGFQRQTDLVLLGMCVWGEARGESREGKAGVAWVARNRAEHPRWWGTNLKEVILKPYQFSSFLSRDPNSAKLLHPLTYDSAEVWDECYLTGCEVMAGAIPDPTGGADHYFDVSILPPKWATSGQKTLDIGRLHFYRIYI